MSVVYIQNPEDNVVHVQNPMGCGEFTFCDRDTSQQDHEGFVGRRTKGPCTCPDCHEQIARLRSAILGV